MGGLKRTAVATVMACAVASGSDPVLAGSSLLPLSAAAGRSGIGHGLPALRLADSPQAPASRPPQPERVPEANTQPPAVSPRDLEPEPYAPSDRLPADSPVSFPIDI